MSEPITPEELDALADAAEKDEELEYAEGLRAAAATTRELERQKVPEGWEFIPCECGPRTQNEYGLCTSCGNTKLRPRMTASATTLKKNERRAVLRATESTKEATE